MDGGQVVAAEVDLRQRANGADVQRETSQLVIREIETPQTGKSAGEERKFGNY